MRCAPVLPLLLLLSSPAVPAAAAEPSSGEAVYETLCRSCHGPYGRGDGPLADALERRPPDFTAADWIGGRSDAAIVQGLRSGHAPMAVGAVLEEEALREAVAFVRRLSTPGGGTSVRAGRDIYQAACWACHGREGRGDGPAAAGRDPAPRDFTAGYVIEGREEEVARIIALGPEAAFHGSPDMPAWARRLSPQQIRDVVAYLKTFTRRGAAAEAGR